MYFIRMIGSSLVFIYTVLSDSTLSATYEMASGKSIWNDVLLLPRYATVLDKSMSTIYI